MIIDADMIERMGIQEEMSMEYLAKPEVAKQIQIMMLDLLRQQLFGVQNKPS